MAIFSSYADFYGVSTTNENKKSLLVIIVPTS